MRFVIVTGMSGAGKSTAMKMMEDMGFFCIDNLPIPLLDKLVDFATNFDTQMKNVAIGIDARSGENLDKVQDMLEILKSKLRILQQHRISLLHLQNQPLPDRLSGYALPVPDHNTLFSDQ